MDSKEREEVHAQVKKDVLKEIEHEGHRFSKNVFNSLGTYLGAAFGFVTGLAWNNAIQALINYYVPNRGGSITIQFLYAILLTVAVATGTYVIVRISDHDNSK